MVFAHGPSQGRSDEWADISYVWTRKNFVAAWGGIARRLAARSLRELLVRSPVAQRHAAGTVLRDPAVVRVPNGLRGRSARALHRRAELVEPRLELGQGLRVAPHPLTAARSIQDQQLATAGRWCWCWLGADTPRHHQRAPCRRVDSREDAARLRWLQRAAPAVSVHGTTSRRRRRGQLEASSPAFAPARTRQSVRGGSLVGASADSRAMSTSGPREAASADGN